MSYSTIAHALINYVECHLENMDLGEMAKSFGMTPSRFRSERPLIGRKQLEAGVYGLEQLDRKTTRSDEIMMEQNKNNTILYGIRKIERRFYKSCPYKKDWCFAQEDYKNSKKQKN